MHYVYINQWVNEFVAKVTYLHHSQFLFWTYLCCGLPAMQIFCENPGLSGCVMCSKPSCLGNPWCSEWDCDCCASDPEFESDMKDFKGPPLKKTKSTVSRFSKPTSPTRMQTIFKGYVPPNTQKATGWAVRVFNEWRAARNMFLDGKFPLNLLEDASASNLNYWLSRFIVEARREDGCPYPATSLNNILSGLYRYCKVRVFNCANFMDRRFQFTERCYSSEQLCSIQKANPNCDASFTSLFSGLNHCSVNISPQNFNVNLNPNCPKSGCDVDKLLEGVTLDHLS